MTGGVLDFVSKAPGRVVLAAAGVRGEVVLVGSKHWTWRVWYERGRDCGGGKASSRREAVGRAVYRVLDAAGM